MMSDNWKWGHFLLTHLCSRQFCIFLYFPIPDLQHLNHTYVRFCNFLEGTHTPKLLLICVYYRGLIKNSWMLWLIYAGRGSGVKGFKGVTGGLEVKILFDLVATYFKNFGYREVGPFYRIEKSALVAQFWCCKVGHDPQFSGYLYGKSWRKWSKNWFFFHLKSLITFDLCTQFWSFSAKL